MSQNERWVSMNEICTHLCASRDTIKKMIKMHDMPAYKIDRKWKFKVSEVDEWMHNRNSISKEKSEVISNAQSN